MPKILLMTHDDLLARAYRARFTRAGFEVDHRATGHDGLMRARQWTPDLMILDLTLPGMHGLDVLKSLRDVPWLVKVHVVLLIERALDRETLNECLLWGAGSYLEKDVCSLEDVVAHLQTILPPAANPSSVPAEHPQ